MLSQKILIGLIFLQSFFGPISLGTESVTITVDDVVESV